MSGWPGTMITRAGDQDVALVEVDVGPAQAAQLAAPGTEHDGQDQEQAQLGVLGHGGLDEPLGLTGLGRAVSGCSTAGGVAAGPGCG